MLQDLHSGASLDMMLWNSNPQPRFIASGKGHADNRNAGERVTELYRPPEEPHND